MFFYEVKKCEPFGEQIETLKNKAKLCLRRLFLSLKC